jgi:hypothetical protein
MTFSSSSSSSSSSTASVSAVKQQSWLDVVSDTEDRRILWEGVQSLCEISETKVETIVDSTISTTSEMLKIFDGRQLYLYDIEKHAPEWIVSSDRMHTLDKDLGAYYTELQFAAHGHVLRGGNTPVVPPGLWTVRVLESEVINAETTKASINKTYQKEILLPLLFDSLETKQKDHTIWTLRLKPFVSRPVVHCWVPSVISEKQLVASNPLNQSVLFQELVQASLQTIFTSAKYKILCRKGVVFHISHCVALVERLYRLHQIVPSKTLVDKVLTALSLEQFITSDERIHLEAYFRSFQTMSDLGNFKKQ